MLFPERKILAVDLTVTLDPALMRGCPEQTHPLPPHRLLICVAAPDLVSSLRGFLKQLIELSHSAGDCPSDPVAPGVDPKRAEFFAAMRGLFGPEAGPPDDDHRPLRRRVGQGTVEAAGTVGNSNPITTTSTVAAINETAEAPVGVEEGVTPSSLPGTTAEGAEGEGCEDGSDGPVVDVGGEEEQKVVEANGSPPLDPGTSGVSRTSTKGDTNELQAKEARANHVLPRQDMHSQEVTREGQPGKGAKDEMHSRRTWETPEQARERLKFRLKIVERRLDIAVAAAASAAPRRSVAEPWISGAAKMARAAGVGTMHGRTLVSDDALAGGTAGVTW